MKSKYIVCSILFLVTVVAISYFAFGRTQSEKIREVNSVEDIEVAIETSTEERQRINDALTMLNRANYSMNAAEAEEELTVMTPEERAEADRKVEVAKKIREFGKTAYWDNVHGILDEMINEQEQNSAWTRATENIVDRRLSELELDGVSATKIKCGETLCTINLAFDNDEMANEFNGGEFFDVEQFRTNQLGTLQPDENGRTELKFYYATPDVPGDHFAEAAERVLKKLTATQASL